MNYVDLIFLCLTSAALIFIYLSRKYTLSKSKQKTIIYTAEPSLNLRYISNILRQKRNKQKYKSYITGDDKNKYN